MALLDRTRSLIEGAKAPPTTPPPFPWLAPTMPFARARFVNVRQLFE